MVRAKHPVMGSLSARSECALPPPIKRRYTHSLKKGETWRGRQFNCCSFTVRGPYFISTGLKDTNVARSYPGFRACRSSGSPKAFATRESINFRFLKKRPRVYSSHPVGCAPPGGMVNRLFRPGDPTDYSALFEVDFQQRVIGERRLSFMQSQSKLLASVVRSSVASFDNPSGWYFKSFITLILMTLNTYIPH